MSAQRPRASERRDPERRCSLPERLFVLNARGHRSGEISLARALDVGLVAVLNARGHRSGEIRGRRPTAPNGRALVLNARGHRSGEIQAHAAQHVPERTRVLNARGHRSGEIRLVVEDGRMARGCSTPEGIGAARSTMTNRLSSTEGRACSTPEGIGAARSMALEGPRPGREVLNARGHRSGEITLGRSARTWRRGCRAQRPRASERRNPGGRPHLRTAVSECSTPEGIGAARSRMPSTRGDVGECCAQRPRASERRDHGGAGTTARPRNVLNARGHRSGEIPWRSRSAALAQT